MTMPIQIALLKREIPALDQVAQRLEDWGCALTSCSGSDALFSALASGWTDIVIIDAGIPDGLATISALKASQTLRRLPVIATALEDPGVVAANAVALGADDVVILPVEDAELYARARTLSRISAMEVERDRRESVLETFGARRAPDLPGIPAIDRISLLLVGPAGQDQVQVMSALGGAATVAYAETGAWAIERLRNQEFDVMVITGLDDPHDIARLCAHVREDVRLFDLPVVLVARPNLVSERSLPFDWGASDVLLYPFHPEIVRLRIQGWVRQQRLRRRLRGVIGANRVETVVDGLTRLYGHGFLHAYVERLLADARHTGQSFAMATFSLARMRRINADFGYAIGDLAVATGAGVLARACRAEDLPARFGGDQFCVVVGNASLADAVTVGERISRAITNASVQLSDNTAITLSCRAGIATASAGDDAASLIARAFETPLVEELRAAS